MTGGPADVARAAEAARGLREAARAAGLARVVWIGMGGAGAAARLVAGAFPPGPDGLPMRVIDTIAPSAILAAERDGAIEDALFVVASKTGTTIETIALGRHFLERVRGVVGDRAGDRFVAVTDPGTALEALAKRSAFRRVVPSWPGASEWRGALGPIGLVAAELRGVPLAGLVLEEPRDDDEAAGRRLGEALADLAREGRDKLTLVADAGRVALAELAGGLFAATTGKAGRGIVPVVGEPLGGAWAYEADRVFLEIASGATPRALAALAAAHPLLALDARGPLGAVRAVRRLEAAALAAAEALGVDPSDADEVREIEGLGADLVARARAGGAVAEPEPTLREGRVVLTSRSHAPSLRALCAHAVRTARPGDYLAVHAYLPETDAVRGAIGGVVAAFRAIARVPVAVDFGPRVLHGAGALHRVGPPRGALVQLTADVAEEVDLPGEPVGFGGLARAQALTDLLAHWHLGRPAVRLHLGRDPVAGLEALAAVVRATAEGIARAA